MKGSDTTFPFFILHVSHMAYTREDVARSLLRITLGLIFFWAFVDKLFGLHFATASGKSWLDGVSPTAGFLKAGVTGPFVNIFHALAGSPIVDWVFMIGLCLIGLSLILGIGVRVATATGSILLLFMWLALLPPKNHPFLDEHIVYVLALCVLYHNSGVLGFQKWWGRTELVRKHPCLQ